MDAFLDSSAKAAQSALDAREEPPVTQDKCPVCQQPAEQNLWFKCQDCPLSRTQCRTCTLQGHCSRPFDRIRQWDDVDECWKKVTLTDLGHIIWLGHEMQPCKVIPTQGNGRPFLPSLRSMAIVHEHGVMECKVAFCRCEHQRHETEQLILAGLWPATWDKPKTATTLAALDAFHGLSLQAHVNLHDYVEYLKRCTDAVRTETVAVSEITSGAHTS